MASAGTDLEAALRIDARVSAGAVSETRSSGQTITTLDAVLRARDPRDAWRFAQRLCGTCSTAHTIAAVRAVEHAIGLEIPANAQYIRNLILALHALHDHITHFYQQASFDWVDVESAAAADPAKASQLAGTWWGGTGDTRARLQEVRDRIRSIEPAPRLRDAQQGYAGHPQMRAAPESSLLAISHRLDALAHQQQLVEALALVGGGRAGALETLAVGGITLPIDLDSPAAIDMARLYRLRDVLEAVQDFVQHAYVFDICVLGARYPDWLSLGRGVRNYFAVPDMPLDAAGTRFDLPGGVITGGDLHAARAIASFDDEFFMDQVWSEFARAMDRDGGARGAGPTLLGHPVQVGPLAQVLVGLATGHKPTVTWTDRTLSAVSVIANLPISADALESTLGRHVARAIRTALIAERALKQWNLLVNNIARGDTATRNEPVFPAGEQRGFGLHEAPRGVLAHAVSIRNGRVDTYRVVLPSAWNAAPRGSAGEPGPCEAALVGNPVADTRRPLEVLRTVHSFDACAGCAIDVALEGTE